MRKLLLSFITILLSFSAFAQDQFTGDWEGSLNVGQSLVVILHIEGAEPAATMDIPAQGAADIACSKVIIDGDKFSFTIPIIKASYTGTLNTEKIIEGTFAQNGMEFPLDLKYKGVTKQIAHPQTPEPPYPYHSEDVVYKNADGSMEYGATITYPKEGKKFPAVLLITGSGAQNRDEEIKGHKPFAVIADQLTKNGYAVLRVDDRGVGKTSKGANDATSADHAKDVYAGITYLKSRKEIKKKKIGLLGHSEGGMIAPIVATEHPKDVGFIILLAGAGVNLIDGMTAQNIAYRKSLNMPENVAEEYGALYKEMAGIIVRADSKEQASTEINSAVDKWKKTANPMTVQYTTGITDEVSQKEFVGKFADMYDGAWFRYLLGFDPQPVLSKVECPVLAIFGEKDIQVLAVPNSKGMEEALAKAPTKNYKIVTIDGVNHLFQECKLCTVAEYGKLEQTISPKALNLITNWMNENVK